jgi:hypothetical protein
VVKVTSAVASIEITEEQTESKTAEQWDDQAVAPAQNRKGAAAAGHELRDMKSLDPKRSDQGYIAEKLRVEETKAQLASAREGMEREAAKLKEDRVKKDEKKAAIPTNANPRFGAAAASIGGGGTGGKWLPPHLRAGTMPRARMPGQFVGGFQKVDTQDEQLFPDLATADAIIERQQKDSQPAFKAPKKTPVGGGATWATKIKKPSPKAPRAPKVEPKVEEAPVEKKEEEPVKAESSATTESSAVKAPIKKRVVKKKKDLSTFKPGSS